MNTISTTSGNFGIKRYLLAASVAVLAGVLASCGGGGSSGGGGTPVVVSPPPPPPNTPPVLTGNLTPQFSENTDISFFLSVDDADGDTVTVTIGTSDDGQFFTLDTGTGEIRSTQQFDFENPQDVDGDNVYVQTVTLNDGTDSVTRDVTVTITNQDEAPTCTVLADTNVDENATGLVVTISGTDPDAGDDANAVVENLRVDPIGNSGSFNLIDFFSLAPNGDVTQTSPLDAEAFEDNFTFSISADYNTGAFSDRCNVNVGLTDLPTRVTSGLLITENLTNAVSLSDLNGDGTRDLWLPDPEDNSGTAPITGTLVYGQSLADSLGGNNGANLSLGNLVTAQKLDVTIAFDTGGGNAASATVTTISDVDGDGTDDLFIGTNNPPNDGLDPTRRPWGYVVFADTIANNTTGTLEPSSLTATEAISFTGPVDFNGSNASYVVANLDGVAGDEIAISLPGAIGFGSENGAFYVIDGAAFAAASGNFDFDLDASTRSYQGDIDIDAEFQIGTIKTIGDLDVDGSPELLMQSLQSLAIIPSINLISSTGGGIDSLNPLLLSLGTDRPQLFGAADVDGDTVSDLLLTRSTTDFDVTQASVVFGDALAPIVSSDSTVELNDTNFNIGDFVDLSSSGSGEGRDPIRLSGLGDLDGDGLEDVAFSTRQSEDNLEQGFIYIVKGSALSSLTANTFNFDDFTAAQGTRLGTVPFQFLSISTRLSRTPDIDGDGVEEFYMTSNRVAQSDPEGVALVIKSTDVVAALNNGDLDVDLEALFFNETPP